MRVSKHMIFTKYGLVDLRNGKMELNYFDIEAYVEKLKSDPQQFYSEFEYNENIFHSSCDLLSRIQQENSGNTLHAIDKNGTTFLHLD